MSDAAPKVGSTYEYKRYMRNGSVEVKTGTVRSRSAGRKKQRGRGKKTGAED